MDENGKPAAGNDGDREAVDASADLVRDLATSAPPKSIETVKAASDTMERTKGGAPDNDLEDRIRVRAYELWEQSGWSDGKQAEFWLQAEAELK